MASPQVLEALANGEKALAAVDLELVTRPDMGTASQEAKLKPLLGRLDRLRVIVNRYAPSVHDSHVQEMGQVFQRIASHLSNQASRDENDWMANREGLLNTFRAELDAALAHQPAFVSAAVLERGFLEDEGIRKEYERTVEELREASTETLKQVKEEAKRAVGEAKQLAEDIENRARKTATKISVKDAQDQFSTAQVHFNGQAKKWAWISGVVVVLFLGLIYWFYEKPIDDSEGNLVFASRAILRVFGLSIFAAIFSFAFKMLRAFLHMGELNLHRLRVSNSMEAFVQSAVTSEQRDAILANLVESVVNFGNSGILAKDGDTLAGQKVGVQAISSFVKKGVSGGDVG